MTDIVERLRQGVNGVPANYAMRQEAADLIEELTKALRLIAYNIGVSEFQSDPNCTPRDIARAALEERK
jgi:hypothetical protein